MSKTNWQDPKTSETRSTHISGLQEAVGKIEESIGISTKFEADIPLTEVFISNDDRYRIFQAPEGKRNWALSPTPIIKENGAIITTGFEIDYGGGAIILDTNDTVANTYTADATYTINTPQHGVEIIPLGEDIPPSERKSKLYLKVTDKQTKEIYGVRHWFNASNTALERLYDSIGFEVNVGIDGAVVRNDFDNVYPFNQIKTVNVDESLNITAYEGDSNFTRDGSNGDVMVMFPKFYVKDVFTDTYKDELISKYKLPGFYCPQKFINEDGTEKDYGLFSAYEGSLSEDGTKLRSVSGAFPAVSLTRNAFTQRAMAKGAGWTIEDIATRDIEERLVNIVFADLNVQNLVQGCVSLPASNNITAVIAESGVNRIIVSNSNASGFVVDQAIGIGTNYSSSSIANNRIVTSITDYDADNKAINFDGGPVDIVVGNVVATRAWKTGTTDDCKASISVYTANNGKYPFKFYGIENIWGHLWKFIQGVNIRDHQVWVCTDPTQYADNKFEEPYKQLSYICPAENGYVKEMGYDARYPFAKFPITVGGSSAVYYADYYYQSAGDRVACVGGAFDNGVAAGLRRWHVYDGSGYASFTFSARLSA